jgi:predicted GNAT family acetyltransferase
MSVRVTNDPAEFAATVFPFLEKDPVLNTIIISNVAERAAGAYRSEPGASVFVSVHDADEQVIGVAMRTPDRPVYLGALREDLARGIADAYAERVPELGGVAGVPAAAEAFADRWSELFGTTSTASRGTRLHKLDTLVRLPADGAPRRATEADVQLAVEWVVVEFSELGDVSGEWARAQVRDGCLWFWERDGVPVSMVGHHLPVFGVTRVAPVYTPAEFRRNGYGGALTAHVSGEILARGEQACLYTDLANPTSNKIYAAAGYLPVADFVDYTFAS